jgi:chromosome segregation ATPase
VPLSARIRRIRWAWDRKDERRASVEKLADEVTVLEARLAETKADAVRLAQVVTESLTADCRELRTKLDAAEREHDFISREYDEMNQQRQRMCRDIVEAHKERDKAQALATADREENTRLKAELSVLTSERDLYKGKFAEAARRLDAAEDAVLAERERCLYHVDTYDPRRGVPEDWGYPGALSRVADAIREGKPAK